MPMKITIDTSALIAVVVNEPEKPSILNITRDSMLVAPESVHWEIGNAFSAMIKRERTTLELAKQAIEQYGNIPIKFIDIDLSSSLELTAKFRMYAYDAYLIKCAQQTDTPLLSLDKGLIHVAKSVGIEVLEV